MTLLHDIEICHSPPKMKTMTKILAGAVPLHLREPGGTMPVMTPT